MAKTVKALVRQITKAADESNFSKFVSLLSELLSLLSVLKPMLAQKAEGGAKKKADNGMPSKEEIENCLEALDTIKDDATTHNLGGAKAGLFGGAVNWKVVVPLLVDVVKKILESLAAQSDE